MGKDLDHLAQVITGALQEVDEEQPVAGPQPLLEAADPKGDREPLAATQLNQDQDLKSDKGQEPNQKDTLSMKQQGGCVKEEKTLATLKLVLMCLFSVLDIRL